jgi:hypothetical protein
VRGPLSRSSPNKTCFNQRHHPAAGASRKRPLRRPLFPPVCSYFTRTLFMTPTHRRLLQQIRFREKRRAESLSRASSCLPSLGFLFQPLLPTATGWLALEPTGVPWHKKFTRMNLPVRDPLPATPPPVGRIHQPEPPRESVSISTWNVANAAPCYWRHSTRYSLVNAVIRCCERRCFKSCCIDHVQFPGLSLRSIERDKFSCCYWGSRQAALY